MSVARCSNKTLEHNKSTQSLCSNVDNKDADVFENMLSTDCARVLTQTLNLGDDAEAAMMVVVSYSSSGRAMHNMSRISSVSVSGASHTSINYHWKLKVINRMQN